LANRVWSAAFVASLDDEQTKLRHRALANMYLVTESMGFVHHAFAGGLDELGLSGLELRRETVPRTESGLLALVEQDAGRLTWCYPLAIATAQRLGRKPRDVNDLRRWQFLGSIVSTNPLDRESAKLWLAQLSHDAGLDLYRRDTTSATPQERLTSALTGAHARYLATPEDERVYPVEQAIRLLGEYVVIGVVEGARSLDVEMLYSLPDIVEPYVPLSPLLEAIWLNMLGARYAHCHCDYERALELWRQMLDKLDAVGETGEVFVTSMRNAVMFAIGSAEAQLGLASAASWAARLDGDGFQRLSALNLRKLVRLEQGDAEGAERWRRQAEVLALQQRYPSMFNTSGTFEVFAYAQCNDLAGLTQVIEQLRPLAARSPSWVPVLLSAEGSFQQVRGDYEVASAKYEACLEIDRKKLEGVTVYPWTRLSSQVGLAECLMNMGRVEEARAFASAALLELKARCRAGIGPASLVRVLALAEAKLGDARGVEKLDALIAKQNAIGATGLRVGLSYEARARIAIWSGDEAAFEKFSQLTAREYRHGARTTLGARYALLMNEAARSGMQAKLTLADFQALESTSSVPAGDERITMITRSISDQRSARERTKIALQAICTALAASEGYLFLITPAGPVLRASQGGGTPARLIGERVAAYVSERQSDASDLDEMATGMLEDDVARVPTVQTGARRYELLPLGCVKGATSVLVGVAVIELAVDRERDPRRALLLHAVAQTLLTSGDSPGLALHMHEE
jgi:tetratricopeptide (TPR) repeat protein